MREFGNILFTKSHDAETGFDTITADWYGSDIVTISHELIDQADPRYLQRDGDKLAICQFQLRIVGVTGRGDFIAERVN